MPLRLVWIGIAAGLLVGCEPSSPPAPEETEAITLSTPPVAAVKPHASTWHGIELTDPYHWLKDQSYPTVDDPEVLAYLEAENGYFESIMSPHQGLIDTLFEEIKARQQQDLSSVPFRHRGFFYQWRFEEGGQYRIWSRWPAGNELRPDEAPENASILLDGPALAEGHDYFRLGGWSVSNDSKRLAYSLDTNGSERFTLSIKDIDTGTLLGESIEEVIGSVVWASDDQSFFYTNVDENWRPYRVRRHVLGTDPNTDVTVYEEEDPSFFVGVGSTADDKYIVISAGDHVTSEQYLVSAEHPDEPPRLVLPRREGHEYSVDHQHDRFVILTNDVHKNRRIATAPTDDPTDWTTLLEGSDELYIRDINLHASQIVVEERIEGLDHIRIIERDGTWRHVRFDEASFTVGVVGTDEFDSPTVRLSYTSMVTPGTVFDYDLQTDALITRKVQEIPSGYDASLYVTERMLSPSRDGVRVPVSLVRRKDTKTDGSAPVFLYAYGAYGAGMSPQFSTTRLSLLDRGFVYAIAHVRGGDELGYHWYEDGKLEKRTNTFNDFVDVARHLIDVGLTQPGRIAINGASAGGELMGAVVNQAPELWGAVIAGVPFVDVLNTMLDDSLPLTPIEWPEWGNPIEDKAAFELIQSYSPYDQLKERDYPPMMVTAGLNDPRVTYWEPAKYVAKLRTLKTDDNVLIFKTNMGAGHGGRSGRFDSLYEVAEEYAFAITSIDQ